MPLTAEIIEVWDGRGGNLNSQRERNYTRRLKVCVSDPTVGMEVIRLLPGVPRLWDVYATQAGTYDGGSFCQGIDFRQLAADPYTWDVTAQYTNKIQRPDLNIVENPLLRAAEIEYDTVNIMVPLLEEPDGAGSGEGGARKPIQNSAKDYFDPPVEVEEYRLVINITRNLAIYDPLFHLGYFNTLNSDAFLGFPKGMVKCARIKAKRAYENGVYHWPTNYEFHVRLPNEDVQKHENVWQAKVLDRGYHYLKQPGNKKTLCTDRYGRVCTSPRLLDGAGNMLPPKPGDDSTPKPEFLYFNVFRKKPFSALNLF
jgi:hypothetical protein